MQTELLPPSPKDEGQGLFFTTPELAQRLDFIRHLTENSDYVPLIKGIAGTGKTHMANRLQSLAGEHWVLCRIEGDPALHPHDLVRQCARCFGVTQTQGRMLEHLLHRLDDMRLAGRIGVILVDDAHLLPPETLVLLFGLHAQSGGDFPLVRIVMFADPRIDELFATPRFEAVDLQKVHSLQIPRLKAQQIPRFMKFVLGEHAPPLSDALPVDEVVRLYRKSGGIPGRLLDLIGNGSSRKEGTLAVRRRLPWKAGAGLAAMILLVSLVLLYQDDINRLIEPRATIEQAAVPSTPQAKPDASPGEAAPPRPEPVSASRLDQSAVAVPQADTESPPKLVADAREIEQIRPELPDSPPQIEQRAPASPEISETPTQDPVVADVPPIQPEKSATQQPAKEQGFAKTPAAAHETPAGVASETPRTKPVEAQAPTKQTAAEPVDKGWRREAWLLAQNPEAFTMQLIGVREEATLGSFIERYGLQDKAVYYQTRSKNNNLPWYSLLYGVYPDRETAEAARTKLPPPLRKKDIWFRRLDAVQEDIRASAQ